MNIERLRRLRRTPAIRDLVRETRFDSGDLIYPIFISETAAAPEPIPSMPGQHRLPVSAVVEKAREACGLGVGALLLFGLPASKDASATSALEPDGVVPRAVREIKQALPNAVIMTDVCVCGYTDHGHCGILEGPDVDNDRTLELLAQMAVHHARAGADVVAPSAMMDGQVQALRAALDDEGFQETAVMGYSAKFSSAFYGPFRDAADSSPSFGDRATYQHDFGNPRHARREILADVREGADIVMVKPGLAYLDVIRMARETTDLPIAAYNVSGEYSMVKAASERGWLDERKTVLETLTAFRRAGADLIITYYALEAAQWLNRN
jgi:porphobilinogen synthase